VKTGVAGWPHAPAVVQVTVVVPIPNGDPVNAREPRASRRGRGRPRGRWNRPVGPGGRPWMRWNRPVGSAALRGCL